MSNRFSVDLRLGQLSLPLCVVAGQVFRWQQLGEGNWVGVDGSHWYRIREGGLRLNVESNAGPDEFSELFRLDWDEREINAKLLEIDSDLEPYMSSLRGLRLMRPSDPVETFFCFLCTPNNNVTRITGMVRTLGAFGEPLTDGLTVFPTVERVAEIPEAELRAKGFGYRGGTIPRIAQELLGRGGADYLHELKSASYEDAHAALCSFNGIGPKLADCIALFALHHTEAVPVDTHLWQAATRLYFPQWRESALTDLKYRAIGTFFRDRFGKLAGWAHQYLFYDNLLNWRSRR